MVRRASETVRWTEQCSGRIETPTRANARPVHDADALRPWPQRFGRSPIQLLFFSVVGQLGLQESDAGIHRLEWMIRPENHAVDP